MFAKVIVKNVFEILSNSLFFCKLEYWQVIELIACFSDIAVNDVDLEYVGYLPFAKPVTFAFKTMKSKEIFLFDIKVCELTVKIT